MIRLALARFQVFWPWNGLLAALFLLSVHPGWAASSANYAITVSTLDDAGTLTASANYGVLGATGQRTVTGASAAADDSIQYGFIGQHVEGNVPTIPQIALTPDSPTTVDPLVCTVTLLSIVGPGLTAQYLYEWSNGTDLVSHGPTTASTDTLSSNFTVKGQTWVCRVRGFDGSNYSPGVGTDSVSVLNTPPAAPALSIPSVQSSGANLRCTIAPGADPDGDVTFHVQWYLRGSGEASFAPWTGLVIVTQGFTQIDNSDTAPGDAWYCEVTPFDEINGVAVTSEVASIVAGGVVPSLITLSISSPAVILGQSVTLSGLIFPAPVSGANVFFTSHSPSGSVSQVFPPGVTVPGSFYLQGFYPTAATAGRNSWSLTSSWPGDLTYQAAESLPVTLDVAKAAPSLSLLLSASSVPANDPEFDAAVTLTAPLPDVLLSLLANQPIALSVRDPFGSTTLVIGTTNAQGVAVFPYAAFAGIDFSQAGTWQFQALFEESDNFLQTTSPNFDAPDVARLTVKDGAGYAIVCVGQLDQNAEGLEEHTKTAEFVYGVFRERGFAHEDISYLAALPPSPQSGIVLGAEDTPPSQANLLGAIQNWAATAMNTAAAPLYVVLISHGGTDAMYLYNGAFGPDRILTPVELDAALNTLEGSLTGDAALQDIHIVYGACHAGSFIDELSAPGRILMTSSRADELSHRGVADPNDPNFVRDGEPFITEYFRALRNGQTAKAAFETAASAIEEFTASTSSGGAVPQHPQLDDNGDGLGSPRDALAFEPGYDGALAHESVLGFGANAAGDSVGWFFAPGTVVLAPGQALSLTARATESPAIGHTAWVEVKKPDFAGADPASTGSGPEDNYEDFQQVLDLEIFLSGNTDPADGNFNWSNFGTSFDLPGTYKVYYYLKDGGTGETSAHLLTTVYRQSPGNTPPPVSALVYPANAVDVSTQSFFAWAPSLDPDGDPVTYRIEFATDSGFTQDLVTLENIAGTHTQVPGLVDGRTYLWRVVPIDAFGAIPTAPLPVRTVTMNNSNPDTPGAISGGVRAQSCSTTLVEATVKLFLTGQSQLVDEVITDDLGEYFFPLIPPGNYRIEISASRFKLQQVASVSVFPGSESDVSTAYLNAAGIIGDVDGNNVTNALDATLISLYLLFGSNACALNDVLPPDINPFRPEAADVNLSSSVTALDATLLNLEQLMGHAPLNTYLQQIGQPLSHAGESLP